MKKIVNSIIVLLAGIAIGTVIVGQYMNKIIIENAKLADKHLKMFQVMKLWVSTCQNKKCMEQYLADSGYHNIAIYGLSFIGEALYQELAGSNIKISFGIDQSVKSKLHNLKVYHPSENLPEVDAVIVTAVTYFDDIEATLVSKMKCPIISIEDVLLEM